MLQVNEIQLEMRQAHLSYEAAVAAALSSGGPSKTPSGWSHETISTDALTGSLTQLRAFPRETERGRALEAQAVLILKLRTALLTTASTRAASWASVFKVLNRTGLELTWLELTWARHDWS